MYGPVVQDQNLGFLGIGSIIGTIGTIGRTVFGGGNNSQPAPAPAPVVIREPASSAMPPWLLPAAAALVAVTLLKR